MADYEVHHEIVASNQDVDVRFYLSVDQGSYVAPHWHNSLEIIYMLEGSMHVKMEKKKYRQVISVCSIPERFILSGVRRINRLFCRCRKFFWKNIYRIMLRCVFI